MNIQNKYINSRSEDGHDVTLWYKQSEQGTYKYNHLESGLSNEIKPIPKSKEQLDWNNHRWVKEYVYIYDNKVIHQGEFDFGYKLKPVEGTFYPIPEYAGYRINSNGEIKSYKRSKKGKLLSWHIGSNGYWNASFCENSNQIRILKHRILAEVFLANPFGFKYVNHKDGNPLNCELSNLQWTPHKENIRHSNRGNYDEIMA